MRGSALDKKGLPAIVVSRDLSQWGSCRIITPNLEAAYRGAFGQRANYFNYTASLKPLEIWALAKRIHAARPERLVFIDHAPHPRDLLRVLEDLYGSKPLPPVHVHVYGDFTLYLKQWLDLEETLKRTRARFICASHRQARLVSKMLLRPARAVDRCHFPLDTGMYLFDPGLRRQWRDRLRIENDEHLFVYTGRLSLQKNVLRLAQEFMRFRSTTGLNARLALAGTFDDLGAPFFGVRPCKGYYERRWLEVLSEQRKRSRRLPVEYLGNFAAPELRGLYNAADTYVSLSLHHDEDYGMSPAEALSAGVPTVLTDWGGYASFDDGSGDCELIETWIGNYGLNIASNEFWRALMKRSLAPRSEAARRALSAKFQSRLSIGAAEETIRRLHDSEPPRFVGFSAKMRKMAECFERYVPFPGGPRRGGFYEEIYEAYVNPQT